MNEKLKYNFLNTGQLFIPDVLFHKLANYYLHLRNGIIPRKLNIKNPKTFNEKIIYSKLHNKFKDAHLLADKYEVRKFIENTIGNQYLIPLLGLYDSPEEIDFASLPEKFVLKIAQGSGWNIIVTNQNELNVNEVKSKLNSWLKMDYSIYGREWQYKSPKNRIIIEEFLENNNKNSLHDYKFFCFNGVPQYIQVDIDRMQDHTRNFYDLNWKAQPFKLLYPNNFEQISKPERLEDMISLASQIALELSTKMDFVRLDFYECNKKIFFGEITFHPDGGAAPFEPQSYDELLGRLIELT